MPDKITEEDLSLWEKEIEDFDRKQSFLHWYWFVLSKEDRERFRICFGNSY
jgi:hypothetical protein